MPNLSDGPGPGQGIGDAKREGRLMAAAIRRSFYDQMKVRWGDRTHPKRKPDWKFGCLYPEWYQNHAHHEAAHAVVARILGVDVSYAALFPYEPKNAPRRLWPILNKLEGAILSGTVQTADCDPELDVVIIIAGACADKIFHPDLARAEHRGGSIQNDRKNFARLIGGQFTKSEVARKFRLAMRKHEPMVRKHWPAIERVAEALFARRVLVKDEIDALIKAKR
jgi:hypothetical protein